MMIFGAGVYSGSGYCVAGFRFPGRKGTLLLNFPIPGFYGKWLVSINLYFHCVIVQKSKLLYKSS
jgi:hypothetical protein